VSIEGSLKGAAQIFFYKTTKNLHFTTRRSLAVVLSIENYYFISVVAKEEEEGEENLGAKRQNSASPKRGYVQPDELSCLKPFPTGPLRRAGRK
jgi:hypothetical protein